MSKRSKDRLLILLIIVSCGAALYWFIKQPGLEPLLAVIGAVIALVTFVFQNQDAEKSNLFETYSINQDAINRLSMRNMFHSYWIEGVLQASFCTVGQIKLEIEERDGLVYKPLDELGFPRESIPKNIKNEGIYQHFLNVGRSLLILGEPGAGKTTLLLEIAKQAIEDKRNDSSSPVAAFFSLSSWKPDVTIFNWLVNELNRIYKVPTKIATTWLINGDLLLLLDGLDELPVGYRLQCIRAINDFRTSNGFSPIIISSRLNDYLQQQYLLELNSAVIIKPLSLDCINRYLASLGNEWRALRITLQKDPALFNLAQTPLMLTIMVNAYKGRSISDLEGFSSVEKRRTHILESYVAEMLTRKKFKKYKVSEIFKILNWLATQLRNHSETIFIEDTIQPSWLCTNKQKWSYLLITRFIAGFFLGFGIPYFLLAFIVILFDTFPSDILDFLFYYAGLLFFIYSICLVSGVIAGIVGLVVAIIKRKMILAEEIKIIETISWSWPTVRNEVKKRLRSWFNQVKNPGMLNDLPIVYYRLLFLIINSLSTGLIPVVRKRKNRFHTNLTSCIKTGLVAGIIGFVYGFISTHILFILSNIAAMAAIFTPEFSALDSLISTNILGLILGIPVSFIGFLRFGGFAIIQHYVVRLILILSGTVPWNFSSSLEKACQLSYLRKAGGGYIFFHKLFLVYFADYQMEYQKGNQPHHPNLLSR